MKKKKKNVQKNRTKNRSKVIALLCILIALLSTVIACWLLVNNYLDMIPRTNENTSSIILPENEFFETDETEGNPGVNDQDDQNSGNQIGGSSNAGNEPSTEITWSDIDPIDDSNLINILLVGQDRRENQGRMRSDTMILCSINTKTKEVSLISFMRDLYVQIPGGYSANRLNAPYLFAGFPLLDETLNTNFGISVDANVEVDFDGFTAIIDAIGGIEITLTAEEAQYLSQSKGWGVEGVNQVNGTQALAFARLRKIDSDFQRTERQREVLSAVFQKAKTLSLSQLLSLVESVLPYITTDMSNSEIISMLSNMFPLLTSVSISSYRIPGEGTYYGTSINGMSVLVPDLQKIRDLLVNEYLPLN